MGALLQAPSNEVELNEHTSVSFEGETFMNPVYSSTIDDIFRKNDMIMDWKLDETELKQLGDVTDIEFFKSVKKGDFSRSKFADLSSDEDGLTSYGLKQVFEKKLDEDERKQMMESLGYNENLYSIKTRMFVFTCHSTDTMQLKIGDNL